MQLSAVHSNSTSDEIRNRVAALQSLAILDTPPEDAFDALTQLAATVCEAPIAIISLIDGDRLWFKSTFGVSATTIPSEHSFCCECAQSKDTLEVPDARADARFAGIGLVSGPLGIQFYGGAPIVYGGSAIGTICVLDTRPRKLPANALGSLTQMARIATFMLRARAEAFKLLSAI